jgi:hypothetical protein
VNKDVNIGLTEDVETKNFGIVAKMILGRPAKPRKARIMPLVSQTQGLIADRYI